MNFSFDAGDHSYRDGGGKVLPHITGMLQAEGLIDDLWFTEESSVRGTAVHDLTAAFDMGALDPSTCVTPYRGYLLAYVLAMNVLKPTMLAVEEPDVHPVHQFGGRPDRVCTINGVHSIIEIKTGVKAKPVKYRGVWTTAHRIQTALQAVLVSDRTGIPAYLYRRLALYLKATGRYAIEAHPDRVDIDLGLQVIRSTREG